MNLSSYSVQIFVGISKSSCCIDETAEAEILLYHGAMLICCIGFLNQAIYMLVAGYFRLTKDVPKPVWRYPVSYIAFHTYAIQVSQHRS